MDQDEPLIVGFAETPYTVASGRSVFDLAGDAYQGQLYQVQVRVSAQRAQNGVTCGVNSAPILLKKLIGVDP